MSDQGCPSREQIAAYLSNSIDEQQSKGLISHLEVCNACQATLHTLSDVGDTLIQQLRSPRVESPYIEEPECQEALQHAANVGLRPVPPPAQVDVVEEPSAPPVQLAEYRLLEKIGEGGMGAVYKAVHTRLDRTVAVKVLGKNCRLSEQATARFEREMKAVGGLSHPNIVQAHDAREIAGTQLLVMEYVDGMSLGEVLRRLGPLPVADACELIRQAATGLDYAHQRGLIHRDIKPSNLMLDRQGQLKILDLGLALLRTDQPAGSEVTSSGQAMGTADYMAPEQVTDSHSVDTRADVYSLGCTFYALLAGHPPFHGAGLYASPVEKMAAQLHEQPASVRQARSEVPPRLAALVDRMMVKCPQERLESAAAVATALTPFCPAPICRACSRVRR